MCLQYSSIESALIPRNSIQLAYDAGLDERNSQGFGMFRFVTNNI
ncbi:MAG: hypothetical protein HPY70_08390 [Firmicutes bacterium]|nr:hypothetical protein [Bacillota bacterium]